MARPVGTPVISPGLERNGCEVDDLSSLVPTLRIGGVIPNSALHIYSMLLYEHRDKFNVIK